MDVLDQGALSCGVGAALAMAVSADLPAKARRKPRELTHYYATRGSADAR